MFNRRETLKRVVACGGLAIALLPCLQQSHALCQVAGCSGYFAAVSADAWLATSAERRDCCGAEAASPCDVSAREDRSDRPCTPECWCCQPPDPREAPRSSTETAKSRLLMDCVCVVAGPVEARWGDYQASQLCALEYLPATSSGEMCARLCRLLT